MRRLCRDPNEAPVRCAGQVWIHSSLLGAWPWASRKNWPNASEYFSRPFSVELGAMLREALTPVEFVLGRSFLHHALHILFDRQGPGPSKGAQARRA